jgi:dTDP-4-dehydrorhamnose 3,5-epimerase
MQASRLRIPEIVAIRPKRHEDHRGYFSEVFRDDWFRANVAKVSFVQENQSRSHQAGTVRGLHFQTEPASQAKLVRCLSGAIFDVAVDLRAGSPTFARWVGCELSEDDGRQLWIPAGFAHGFCTLVPDTVVNYKVSAVYSPAHDKGVRWDDKAIGIDWPPIADAGTLSDKDRILPSLAELPEHFRHATCEAVLS